MRDVFFVAVVCFLAIAIGVYLFTYGPNLSVPMFSFGHHTNILAEGDNADTTERSNYRVTSADELQSLWLLIYGPTTPALPDVDFSKNEVLAVFDGSHGSGGYSIKVVSVSDNGLLRKVTVEHDTPGAHCVVSNAVTSPYQVIVVPKMRTQATLSHVDMTRVVDCK